MTEHDIDMLLHIGERVDFEIKKAENSIPKSVWETYSAFANTIGGVIVLGISELSSVEDKRRFEVSGIVDAEKLKKDFFNTLNSDKVSCSILTDSDVEIISYKGSELLAIHVPQADYRQRPIYVNGNPLKGTFKRNYEGDYVCTEEEVKVMIRDANDAGNDGLLIQHYGIDDIDPSTLRAYRQRFQSSNPDHLYNEYDDKEFLRNMGAYTFDRATGREGLTLAGLLMFGKGLAIRERFDNIRMDYLDMTDLQPDSRWSDRLTYDGRWENNLYNFFTRVLSKLLSDVKRPFVLNGVERGDDSSLHKLIREALTNLVIHADYMITGVLRIEKYNDRFVFSNPGLLKLSIADIYKGGTSRARNPHIQTMLRMVGLGDNIGSGFPTMVDVCKKEHWRSPILQEKANSVELSISMLSIISQECVAYLQQLYADDYRLLDKEEVFVLYIAWAETAVNSSVVQMLLDKNPIEAGRLLYALVDKGLLRSNGRGRWTSYSLNEEYIPQKSRSIGQGAEQKSRSTSQGAKRKSRSNKGELVVRRIIDFCSQPRTLQEIAQMLGYSDRYRMKRNYIDPLLGKDLQMTSAESKTDPNQRYVRIKL